MSLSQRQSRLQSSSITFSPGVRSSSSSISSATFFLACAFGAALSPRKAAMASSYSFISFS